MRNQTGWNTDRYEKRVHVLADGRTQTTYAACDPVCSAGGHRTGRMEWREVTQQAYSLALGRCPDKCHVVVTTAAGVEVKFG